MTVLATHLWIPDIEFLPNLSNKNEFRLNFFNSNLTLEMLQSLYPADITSQADLDNLISYLVDNFESIFVPSSPTPISHHTEFYGGDEGVGLRIELEFEDEAAYASWISQIPLIDYTAYRLEGINLISNSDASIRPLTVQEYCAWLWFTYIKIKTYRLGIS